MPSLEDFLDKLETDADAAFSDYILLIDCTSLDYSGPKGQEVQAEFKLPAEFAHYKRPPRLKAFLNLFYHQLIEQGYWP